MKKKKKEGPLERALWLRERSAHAMEGTGGRKRAGARQEGRRAASQAKKERTIKLLLYHYYRVFQKSLPYPYEATYLKACSFSRTLYVTKVPLMQDYQIVVYKHVVLQGDPEVLALL
jgi:hypothetical protein